MAWVRIDDHYDQNPKIASVGPLGVALWLAGIAYCNRMNTSGTIPWAIARTLVSWEIISPDGTILGVALTTGHAGDRVDSDWVIGLLLDAGLWEDAAGGYHVHDYEEYQQGVPQRVPRGTSGRAAGGKARAATATRIGGRFAPRSATSIEDAGTSNAGMLVPAKPIQGPASPALHQLPLPVPDPSRKNLSLVEHSAQPSQSVAGAAAATTGQWDSLSPNASASQRLLTLRCETDGRATRPREEIEIDALGEHLTPADVFEIRRLTNDASAGWNYALAIAGRASAARKSGRDPWADRAGGTGVRAQDRQGRAGTGNARGNGGARNTPPRVRDPEPGPSDSQAEEALRAVGAIPGVRPAAG